MINQTQLNQLSKKYKINESIVAREFVQVTFLKELYEEGFSRDIYFKGGTAIRLLYGGQRFSEDLDFTVQVNEDLFVKLINKFFSKIENQYPFTFKERKTITGKTYLLTADVQSLKNPVFVKLDFSMRENVLEPTKNIIETKYPVIVQSFINSLSKNEILAEKIRAILRREKHRDIYDLWILLELGARFDMNLIQNKLKYYGEDFKMDNLISRLKDFSKDEFIKDLRPFVPINEREKLGDLFEYVKTYLEKLFSSIDNKSA
ncbi:MAG: hypothetical protein COZ34_02275 [Candidatus Pacebacteria bacterium CG_4_10_14_3_um_filter_34_15]|nr:nucleotidyl transferase AbiEii/AbiGii toxin family protein [Candidatus Pacearchaeota archaeon]NCQ66010.1 nucleotidyl transferase AbiEii/AbiGii toxin family protein [Candidatus Paceibacterota bacterium]OIO43741.1 MAG: hypothetical protein AUJ41_04310 [Candidatus Pacebacteria bacterium CG1_02_43_31]PIX81653.1 MAG: hypothetical protein COZ34_02275 [Candidatus Pacebacteria bacterium CG_4_10_14_3_um_filter_34_15]PJC43363.1 MAG: hypothetical protein CO039_04305 [Candidatus Pacebacteria bacterium C